MFKNTIIYLNSVHCFTEDHFYICLKLFYKTIKYQQIMAIESFYDIFNLPFIKNDSTLFNKMIKQKISDCINSLDDYMYIYLLFRISHCENYFSFKTLLLF